jgi:ferredoxin--NADP+ reductase
MTNNISILYHDTLGATNTIHTKMTAELMQKYYNASIIKFEHLTPDLFILRVVPDQPQDQAWTIPNFFPGQYVALGLVVPNADNVPKLVKRAYSIGSSPDQKSYLEFFIALVKDGALTPHLSNLRVGDRLFCANKITGHFTLEPVPKEANLILIATGTGLAPFISMISTPSTWIDPARQITILHGVRYAQDLAYQAEITDLQRKHPNLKYFPVVSRQDHPGTHRGYVQDLLQNNTIETDPNREHILICGNPSMITDVENILIPRGYIVHSKKTPGNLHLEKYW